MLKPHTRPVGTFWAETAVRLIQRHKNALWWLLSVLAAGVAGWMAA